MAMDAGVAARNLSGMYPARAPQIYDEKTGKYVSDPNFNPELIQRALPQSVESLVSGKPSVTPGQQPYELPSAMFNRSLDENTVVPTGVGKGAEFVSSTLLGARAIPNPTAAVQAPVSALPRATAGADYIVPPSQREGAGFLARTMEGIAGKTSVAQRAAMKNQPVTNELASKAIGLEKVPETGDAWKTALTGIREKAGKVYQDVANSGEIRPDDTYIEELAQLGKSADDILKDFPDAAPAAAEETDKLVNSLLRDKFNARSAMEYLKELRSQAASNLNWKNSADPAKRALGMAQREAAGTLEDLVVRHLGAQGKGELAAQFNQARQQIAKTYVVQGALNESTGNIVASGIGNVMKKGKPLTNELETIAKFARAFPKAAKEVNESFPGISPWDVAMTMTAGLATGNPAVAAYPLARIGLREAMTSRALPRAVGAVGNQAVPASRALASTVAQMENQ
jgi:hypothetical protein